MTKPTSSINNLYNIQHWGDDYFQINASGNIEVRKNIAEIGVELQTIINSANRAGMQLPLLIRFTDILQDRVTRLYQAFEQAIAENDYAGSYELVYPIKVNQEHTVVRDILKTADTKIGLEAGSKPELMAVIGLLGERKATIVCNGYKDAAYIRIALIAQQMGHKVFIVIEKQSELDIILREAELLNVRPKIGIRVRLTTKSAGKWENTGGEKSKFGLNTQQILDAVIKLKNKKYLDCFQLMHCHLGSQIASIHDIRNCMQEVARYYIELRQMGVPITTVDVGGGLGVDYAGTRSNNDGSINYSLKEYATNILLALSNLCMEINMPVPNIISESGRAITAHHAVLVTNITDIEQIDRDYSLPDISQHESHVIRDIWDTYQSLSNEDPLELYHYASHSLNEAHALFKHGVIGLQDKACVEELFFAICIEVQKRLDLRKPANKELNERINQRLAAKLFCNLSLFQSLPDAWAIDQIFPIAPITQLNHPLKLHGILQDLTCDSDGTLKHYTGSACITSTLLLPAFNPAQPYALGFFLVGAYQEILGNLHNLFGDTNSLDVKLFNDGKFEINDLVVGDTITNVLNYAHYDTKRLLQSYEKQLIASDLTEEKIQQYLNELRSVFTQLTYLQHGAVSI